MAKEKILTRGTVSPASRGHAYYVHENGVVDFAGNKIQPDDFQKMAEDVLGDENYLRATRKEAEEAGTKKKESSTKTNRG